MFTYILKNIPNKVFNYIIYGNFLYNIFSCVKVLLTSMWGLDKKTLKKERCRSDKSCEVV